MTNRMGNAGTAILIGALANVAILVATTGVAHATHGQPEVLEPAAAAARLLDALAAWRTGPAAPTEG